MKNKKNRGLTYTVVQLKPQHKASAVNYSSDLWFLPLGSKRDPAAASQAWELQLSSTSFQIQWLCVNKIQLYKKGVSLTPWRLRINNKANLCRKESHILLV